VTRLPADVGRGLAPARRARAIEAGERVHVIGGAGAGASAAAILAARAGALVTACDRSTDSPYVPAVEAAGVAVLEGHDASHVVTTGDGGTTARVDRVAVTKALTSIDPDHAELAAARVAGIPLEPWQQVVADAAVSHGGRLVGVAGTHGKSTSSGWLVELLWRAGRDPSAFVGALLPAAVSGAVPSTARWGTGPEFVVEADEYAGNFDPYRPAVAVLLNAEWDHPDVFADEEAVLEAFEAWIRRADGGPEPPVLVVNAGDRGAARVAGRLADWNGRMVAVTLEPADDGSPGMPASAMRSALGPASHITARVTTAGPAGTALLVRGLDGTSRETSARITLPGRHNAQDALCVAAAAAVLGVPAGAIAAGLEAFRGVGRRLELKGEPGGVVVLDDYAHHPTAIAETLGAVRQRYPGRRVWAVYEPLTYHRTAALLDRFADVLARGADAVVIADIWAGRDPDTTIASAEGLAAAVRARGMRDAVAPGTVLETAGWLASRVRPGDVVLVMGGGHSYRIAERLVEALDATAL
jgi:UDP-N-acetylmuramate--alanine ligase